MGLYDKHILPKLLHLACTNRPVMRRREKVVPLAHGRVLEIGLGSGLNLPYYDADKVSKLWGLDPSPELHKMARKSALSVDFDVEFIGLSAEEIPLETDCADTRGYKLPTTFI